MNNPYDALLSALQRRFVALAGQMLNDDEQIQVRQLIAALYYAQREGDGFVAIEQIDLDMEQLCAVVPQLIGTAEALQTPIVYCPPFVAFRRPYTAQLHIATYLAGLDGQMNPPTRGALQGIDWSMNEKVTLSAEQQLAAITAATLPLTIITGGAGTGKTSTLTKALELILLDKPNATMILAAPTGKAADRLNQSLHAQLATVNPQVRTSLADLQATTLHRLLGISETTGRAFHNASNPVRCDIIAVDEASMVGGELFAMLRAAVLPQTKIILLGDANQLPPIDSTPFFNEVSRLPVGYSQAFCQVLQGLDLPFDLSPRADTTPLPNVICHLTASRRFAKGELVGQAALAVLKHDSKALMTTLESHHAYHPIQSRQSLYQQLAATYATDHATWQQQLPEQMILCANRQGAMGSEAINDYLDRQFQQQFAAYNRAGQKNRWYVGRRIMISRNDYGLSLYNGDIGYCRWSESEKRFEIVFENKNSVPVEWIAGNYSLAFAISIHKSQGSEYQQVDMVLGQFDADNPHQLVTKSLLYTAITRAKKHLRVFGDVALIQYALIDEQQQQSPLRFLLEGM